MSAPQRRWGGGQLDVQREQALPPANPRLVAVGELLTYANAMDPRIQVNTPTVHMWAKALGDIPLEHAREAVERHYRVDKTGRVLTLSTVLQVARDSWESDLAKKQGRMLGAGRPRPPLPLRQADPEAWARLVEQGKRQGNLERGVAS